MADRQVKKSRKGFDGDILTLCNPGEPWSPRFKNDAINDIEDGLHNYFIESRGERIAIFVSTNNGSKHLVSNTKNSTKNIFR